MKKFFQLLFFIIASELVGILGSVFTMSAIPAWYNRLNKPFFAPPNWIFGPVWTLLYALMGISFFLIWNLKKSKNSKKKTREVRSAQLFFLVQLGLNFIWTPVFFGLRSPLLGLIVIVPMWILIGITIRKFYALSKLAAYLLIPYWLWVGFASILNGAVWLLN